MDLVSKSTGDSLTATEFNQIPSEIENALSSTGQSPSTGDLHQLAKAIVDYAGHGDFFADSGSSNTYVLTAQGSKQSPTAYIDGMRVRYTVGNVNTGASTVNVATLGVKNIKTPDGNDPAPGDLSGRVTLEYDAGNGYFIIYDVASGGATPSTLVQDNFAINGTGIIQQRDDYTLVKDAYDFGPDRFKGMATGTAVSAGTLTQTEAASVGVTGFAHKFNQVTITGTGILFHRIRIESKDAKNFKNQIASVSCKVYHNVGSGIDYTLTVRKADVEDDFSATTNISNDGGTSVSSATATGLQFENIDMGDCSNGIEVELKIECGAVTLKDFEQTEYQLKVGTVATPFKPEPVEEILAACQRYARLLEFNTGQTVVDINASASGDYGLYHINHNMRDTPGISDSGDFVFSNTQSAVWSSWKNNTKISLFVRANAAGRATVAANAGAASWVLLESEL